MTKLYKTAPFNDGSVAWGEGWGDFDERGSLQMALLICKGIYRKINILNIKILTECVLVKKNVWLNR